MLNGVHQRLIGISSWIDLDRALREDLALPSRLAVYDDASPWLAGAHAHSHGHGETPALTRYVRNIQRIAAYLRLSHIDITHRLQNPVQRVLRTIRREDLVPRLISVRLATVVSARHYIASWSSLGTQVDRILQVIAHFIMMFD